MARGVNKVILVGTLGQDPEIKNTSTGSTLANLSLATNESWNDNSTGKKIEKTEWHRIVIFGKLAEIAGQYLKKGQHAYFEGKLQTRKWKDQAGQDRYTTEIVAYEMQMLGGKNQGEILLNKKTEEIAPPSYSEPHAYPQLENTLDDIPF